MKPLLIVSVMTISVLASAQSKGTAKLYGYVQEVSGGKRPEISGNTEPSRGPRKNYMLYAVSSTRIYPTSVWVEGVQYGVAPKTISSTPVEYANENNIGSPKQTLVPSTKQKVVQLILNSTPQRKGSSQSASSMAKSNDVVLVYKLGDKSYYTLLKNLSPLEAAAMQ